MNKLVVPQINAYMGKRAFLRIVKNQIPRPEFISSDTLAHLADGSCRPWQLRPPSILVNITHQPAAINAVSGRIAAIAILRINHTHGMHGQLSRPPRRIISGSFFAFTGKSRSSPSCKARRQAGCSKKKTGKRLLFPCHGYPFFHTALKCKRIQPSCQSLSAAHLKKTAFCRPVSVFLRLIYPASGKTGLVCPGQSFPVCRIKAAKKKRDNMAFPQNAITRRTTLRFAKLKEACQPPQIS